MRLMQLLPGALLLMLGELVAVASADCAATALAVIPGCAQKCFINGAPSIGCGGIDFACQCEQEAKLYAAIEGCVASACPSASYQAVIDGASTVCNCATAGLAGGVGSMSVSGIQGSSIGSFVTTAPVTTTASNSGSIGGGSGTTTTRAPGGITGGSTPFTTTFVPFATASVVSGSSRLLVADARVIGTVVAAFVLGCVTL